MPFFPARGSTPPDPAPASPPSLRRVLADLNGLHAVNAVVAFMFAATGPVAIVLAITARGNLSPVDLSSWLFGAFALNGLISIGFSWWYRQPLVLFWTIPGAVLVGAALTHLTFVEVLGTCLATGLIVLGLGASGWVRRAAEALPMPIVMGMVAAVFLRFGLGLVLAIRDDFWIAGPMAATFFVLSARAGLARRVPPLIGALVVGAVVMAALGRFHAPTGDAAPLAWPRFYVPTLSWKAMIELVVPLTITVLVVQNGQGIAVLRAAGHQPPITAITIACGLGSMITAFVGAVPTSLTGPVNAIISGSGEKDRRYTAGIVVGLLGVAFGLLSPFVTRLTLATPRAFIAAIAGLAMLRVLQTAFTLAFKGRCALGALVTFLVTAADVPILSVGAPFWGLVLGFVTSLLLEREDLNRFRAR